jgi:hypothetical protein
MSRSDFGEIDVKSVPALALIFVAASIVFAVASAAFAS